jgi:hypothetical protein
MAGWLKECLLVQEKPSSHTTGRDHNDTRVDLPHFEELSRAKCRKDRVW